MLNVRDLSVDLGGKAVLKRVSFEIPRGSILGLIGPNGAGKTTLVRAISGVLPLQAGRVSVSGQDLAGMPARERAQQVAVVQQTGSLPAAFTAWETVLLGRTPHLSWLGQVRPEDQACARQAMQRTDTLALAARPVGELSGGEQQRILLARALAQATPVLLLDEPTAHLDISYQVGLLGLVRRQADEAGLSILLVMHDVNLTGRFTDQVGLLVRGELQALGTPEQVLDPAVLSQAYQVPLRLIPGAQPGDRLIFPEV